ncbi:MAG: MFS transporter [Solirubrobacteraceae bacterium]
MPVPVGGADAVSARWATTGVFVVNGAGIGTWVAHIPWVQERFDLSKSAMGLVIVAMAIAVILAFPIAGQAIVRHGSERIVWIGGIAMALAVNLPVLAPHPALVALGLLVLGGASATMDVAMNSHGVKVEKELGKPIMSSLHAGWAFGGMAGAGFAALCAALGVDPRVTVAVSSVLLLALLVATASRIGHGSAAAGEETPGFTLPSRGVVLLATMCLLVMVTEGAMADWGGLYLRQDLGASAALAALAYSFFTGGMTVGRVVGDWVNRRIGAVALLRWGALLTGAPLGAMLLIGQPAAALIGLFVVGLGVANGVPLMFSAAGRQPDMPPGPGIAAVSSMGSLGFLAGPPVIGVLADAISLPWALATLIGGAAVVFALARRATSRTQPEPERRIEAHPVAVP